MVQLPSCNRLYVVVFQKFWMNGPRVTQCNDKGDKVQLNLVQTFGLPQGSLDLTLSDLP